MSLPSLMDMAPPPIVAEIQAMKEQMEVMMNALKGRVSNDLDDSVNKIDSPFTTSINSFPLPQKFWMPQIESYDEVKDPLDHLETFKTLMHLQGVPDEIMCRAFPTTLKGPARIGSVDWCRIQSTLLRNWAPSSPYTSLGDIGTRSLQHAWWASSNERMRRWGLT